MLAIWLSEAWFLRPSFLHGSSSLLELQTHYVDFRFGQVRSIPLLSFRKIREHGLQLLFFLFFRAHQILYIVIFTLGNQPIYWVWYYFETTILLLYLQRVLHIQLRCIFTFYPQQHLLHLILVPTLPGNSSAQPSSKLGRKSLWRPVFNIFEWFVLPILKSHAGVSKMWLLTVSNWSFYFIFVILKFGQWSFTRTLRFEL